MIYFAHSGSINGEWVSYYALNLAQKDKDKTLVALFTKPYNQRAEENYYRQQESLRRISRKFDIKLNIIELPQTNDIVSQLVDYLEKQQPGVFICGVKTSQNKYGYLPNSITSELLEKIPMKVLAIRVKQPGVLGHPNNLLYPILKDDKQNEYALEFINAYIIGNGKLTFLGTNGLEGNNNSFFRKDTVETLTKLKHLEIEKLCNYGENQLNLKPYQLDYFVNVDNPPWKQVVKYSSLLNSEVVVLNCHEQIFKTRWLRKNYVELIIRNCSSDLILYKDNS